MIELRKTKHQIRKIVYSKVMVVFVGVLVLFAANGTWQVYKKVHALKVERDQAQVALDDLSKQKASVEKSLKDLNTPAGIERSVRVKFGVVKPGEEEVVLVDDTNASSTTLGSGEHKGFWGGILNFLHL